ncbi:hypothetical protein OG982_27645 [Streptomyces sp. NBC_01551]|uniref:hypothetical protein n=1 Tax=Streptomyces sp. NBC_01551 TaxID=2975876 RepID=UPI002259AEF2|nr:hypothetical protein [Streptomyces sp. NBC_01551]MCX4529427.1 hypothetical protein [Streptomyces sp. NBC_01551]
MKAEVDAFTARHGRAPVGQLVREAADRFHRAAEPVAMLTGAGSIAPKNPDAPLPCRLPGELATAIRTGPSGDPHTPPAQRPAPPGIDKLPAELGLPALLDEFYLLVAAEAAGTLSTVRADDATAREAEAKARRTGTEADRKSAREARTAASKQLTGLLGEYGAEAWRQAWQPLFLMWEAEYFPIPYQGVKDPSWRFDGNRFVWDDKSKAPAKTTSFHLKGRLLLSRHCALNLRDRAEQHLRTHRGAPAEDLRKIIEASSAWDLTSQSLDGFNEQLICLDSRAQVVPPDEIREQVGQNWTHTPGRLDRNDPDPHPQFQQIRAGQFNFTRLSVVDRFGHALDLVTKETRYHRNLVRSPGLTATRAAGTQLDQLIQVTPRLPQAARLRFDAVDPRDDQKVPDPELLELPPVVAWLLPNRLDRSLMCHAPDGSALGELRTVYTDKARVGWLPLPGSRHNDLDSLKGPHPQVHAMATQLVKAGPAALTAMLAAVDNALWTVEPPGAEADSHLTRAVGRPLALIRTRLRLDLDRPPVGAPRLAELHQQPKRHAFLDHDWPVRLGWGDSFGDGLIGYFAEGYEGFRAVRPAGSTPGYVTGIGTGTDLTVTAHLPRADTLGKEPVGRVVTLLADPRTPVHAFTELLPITRLRLDPALTAGPLARISPCLRTGPVLAPTRPVRPGKNTDAPLVETLVVHAPTLREGEWLWWEGAAEKALRKLPITPADHLARPGPTAPKLRSGFLHAAAAPPPSVAD